MYDLDRITRSNSEAPTRGAFRRTNYVHRYTRGFYAELNRIYRVRREVGRRIGYKRNAGRLNAGIRTMRANRYTV